MVAQGPMACYQSLRKVEVCFMELDAILDIWEKLGPRERLILMTFGQRMLNGQRKYGKITVGKKDWTYEAIEEALDCAVYLTAKLQDKVEMAFSTAVSDAEKEIEIENSSKAEWITGERPSTTRV